MQDKGWRLTFQPLLYRPCSHAGALAEEDHRYYIPSTAGSLVRWVLPTPWELSLLSRVTGVRGGR